MNRRPLVILVLAIASFVCAACTSSVTGPTAHNDDSCITGYMGSSGRC